MNIEFAQEHTFTERMHTDVGEPRPQEEWGGADALRSVSATLMSYCNMPAPALGTKEVNEKGHFQN